MSETPKQENPFRCTALAEYRRCGRSWYYGYGLGLKSGMNGYQCLGKAFHAAAAEAMRKVKEGDQDSAWGLPLWEEAFSRAFVGERDQADWSELEPETAYKDGLRMIAAYIRSGLPQRLSPKHVETKFALNLANHNYLIEGTADLVTTDGLLVDFKTSSRLKRTDLQLQNDFQLHWYAACLSLCTPPILTQEVAWHEVTTKTAREIRGPANPGQAFADFKGVIAGIRTGLFLRARPDDYLCSPRWCSYWDYCHLLKWWDPLGMGVSLSPTSPWAIRHEV